MPEWSIYLVAHRGSLSQPLWWPTKSETEQKRDDLIGRGYWQTTRASQLVYIYQQPEVILHGVKMS